MTEIFHNPIMEAGADPFVTLWRGNYYYVYSAGGSLYVSRADNLHHLKRDGRCVYTPEACKPYSKELWAPEIHELDGEWYLYVAADDGDNANHRMYVLRSENGQPDGDYTMLGKITDPTDRWAIDGTVLCYGGERYFVWSGWETYENRAQNLYIAKMQSPTEISGQRVLLSEPEYDWEKRGSGPLKDGRVLPTVNEGPQILYKGNTVHIVYSASGSWGHYYCLGILTFRGGDILDPKNWTKGTQPVLSESEGTHGTGHCSFTVARDGVTDFIVYHAMRKQNGGWADRGVRAQPFTWDGDMPIFGRALSPEDPVEIPV